MKKTERPTRLLWLDLEMTGLDPRRDRILEVAAIVTDFNLKEMVAYEEAITHNEPAIKKLLKANPFWGKDLKSAEPILAEMRQGKPEKEVEQELIALIEKYFLPNEPVYLAGNSIRVDRGFIDYWMPQFARMLHYRMLDVTAFKLWWTGKGQTEYKKAEQHRALEDIRESIAELRYYTEQKS